MSRFWVKKSSSTGGSTSSGRPLWKRWWMILPLTLLLIVCVLGVIAAGYTIWALSFDLDRVSRMPATSLIYDRNGFVIQRLYEEHRILVGKEDIPDVLKHAILAKEDSRFYWHPGVDPLAILRSGFINLFSGKVQTGASTITQQLARNSAGIFDRTIDRKLKEMFLAMRIEAAFSKDEILTFYLNRIFFGGNLYGVGAASEAYFGKHPRDLNLEESALLAGIIAAPNAFTPWKNPARAREVRAFTLDRMAEEKFITTVQAKAAAEKSLSLRPIIDLPGTYITSVVRDMLPDFVTEEILFRGGLHIHTTIDLAFQKTATEALQSHLNRVEKNQGYPHTTRAEIISKTTDFTRSPPYLQGAFVAVHNADGGILCVVGGRHHDESTFNRALLSRRQIGSTVKPFVYAQAFNVLNATALTEVDRSAFPLQNARPGMPLTGTPPDFITVRQALETSNNYATMRLGLASGVDTFSYFFSRLTGTAIPAYPSTFLGACELTPLELAVAYSIFPNYGVALEPYLIQAIRTHDGTLLFEHIDNRRRVLSPQVAFQIHHLLDGVVTQGTGRALRATYQLQGGLGGKTGTTNDYKDAWFAGYTSEITAVVWVGFDQPKTIMPGGYAGRLAVPLWGDIMKPAAAHYKPQAFLPPPGVHKAQRKSEETFLWIFKKESVNGPAEYVRDEQRGNALFRLDDSLDMRPLEPESKSLPRRAWEWIFPPTLDDQFRTSEEEIQRAEIYDNVETEAPRAEPVSPR